MAIWARYVARKQKKKCHLTRDVLLSSASSIAHKLNRFRRSRRTNLKTVILDSSSIHNVARLDFAASIGSINRVRIKYELERKAPRSIKRLLPVQCSHRITSSASPWAPNLVSGNKTCLIVFLLLHVNPKKNIPESAIRDSSSHLLDWNLRIPSRRLLFYYIHYQVGG